MPCHLEPQQLPPAVAQNHEHKQAFKGHRRDHAHIDGSDCLSVVLEKRLPGLRRRPPPLIMYLETVDWATSNPSIRSSPWIRGAPHSGFSLLIRRMRSRSSQSTFGLPALFRDFQRQNAVKPERCHRKMVSGFITWDTSSRLGQIRVIHTSSARSLPYSRRRGGARLSDVELMTEKQVLGLEPASRL